MNILTDVEAWVRTILSSAVVIALIWISVWAYSIYSSKKNHKEIITELKEIKGILQQGSLQNCNNVKQKASK